MSITCKKENCFPDIRCAVGEKHKEECPNWNTNKNEPKPAKQDLYEGNAHLLTWSGNSMGLSDLHILSERSSLIQIGSIGEANSGKTTFLGLLYLLLNDGQFIKNWNFSSPFYQSAQPTVVDEIEDHLSVYRGKKRYELKNHLGNVLAVITDNKYPHLQATVNNSSIFQNYFDEPVSDWSTTEMASISYEEGYMNVTVNQEGEGIKRGINLPGGVESNCTYEYCFTLGEPVPPELYFVTYDAGGGVIDMIPAEPYMCIILDMNQVASIGFILNMPGSFSLDEESLTKSCTEYVFQHYKPVIREMHDYYPFGMLMNGRKYTSTDGYRYGFQGQERDDEIKGAGNSIAFSYRIHDPRLGRFLSIDPLSREYPWNSPYAFAENRVIDGIDLEGAEWYYTADGKLLGKFGTSDNIRVLNSRSVSLASAFLAKGKFANVPNVEDQYTGINSFLITNSTQAYKKNDQLNALKDWASKYKSKSAHNEHAVMFFSNTFIDENGSELDVILPGTTIKGESRQKNPTLATADFTKSELIIGGETMSSNKYSEGLARSFFSAKYGWKRSMIVHTHWAGGSINFSLSGGDIDAALRYNLDISLIHNDYNWVKTFEKEMYYKTTKIDYNKGLIYPPIDKGAVGRSTKINDL